MQSHAKSCVSQNKDILKQTGFVGRFDCIIYWQWHRAQPPINSKLIQSHSRSIWPRGSWSASYHFAMHGERRWSGTFKWSSCVRVRVAMCDDDLCMSLCVWEMGTVWKTSFCHWNSALADLTSFDVNCSTAVPSSGRREDRKHKLSKVRKGSKSWRAEGKQFAAYRPNWRRKKRVYRERESLSIYLSI